jgi:hypothetical protein
MNQFLGYFHDDVRAQFAGSTQHESGAGAPKVSPGGGAPAFSPERLAELFDEGQNSSRAWELHEYVEGQFRGETITSLEQMVERVTTSEAVRP